MESYVIKVHFGPDNRAETYFASGKPRAWVAGGVLRVEYETGDGRRRDVYPAGHWHCLEKPIE